MKPSLYIQLTFECLNPNSVEHGYCDIDTQPTEDREIYHGQETSLRDLVLKARELKIVHPLGRDITRWTGEFSWYSQPVDTAKGSLSYGLHAQGGFMAIQAIDKMLAAKELDSDNLAYLANIERACINHKTGLAL